MYNKEIYNYAIKELKNLYGINALFRDGQYEAIEATLLQKRTLIVQKTGWGKSLVYFMCTKYLRSKGYGVTMVISPLLALMDNQVESATKMGLKCAALNSTVANRDDIVHKIIDNKLDLVLITPETLFKDDIQSNLKDIKIGLFVIDEAHCISDWGHDFRLEYCNLKKVIKELPLNVHLLATTATATDIVIEDLKKQIGNDLYVSRGSLTRDSLYIQVLNIPNKAERYAWILEHITELPGSGIIYCLTQRDCDYLVDFLQKNNISAEPYYSDKNNNKNIIPLEKFKRNEIKVLVATIKLGMGFDKGDIAFVIHFQMPKNIVSYYQQIGRAGRNIDKAYVFLMTGKEDKDILNYFIDTAFPTEEEYNKILNIIKNDNGISKHKILEQINIRKNRLEKGLSFLENDGYVYKDTSKRYYISPKQFVYNKKHYDEIIFIRRKEMEEMFTLVHTKECYNKFIACSLDDKTAKECGHCANCKKENLLPTGISFENKNKASDYINKLIMEIIPRQKWPNNKRIEYVNQTGWCISKYGEAGYGELVKRDKYCNKQFCDELLGKSAEILLPKVQKLGITYLSFVPSLRSNIVKIFAEDLAKRLHVKFIDVIDKHPAEQQKNMENSVYQYNNAHNSFYLKNIDIVPNEKDAIILVDDLVDSKWTLTVCGNLLGELGFLKVYPFALADSCSH